MADSEFFSTNAGDVLPTATNRRVATFLSKTGAACHEAWALASAGLNADGPLVFRLIDQSGMALSDWSETSASSLERVKMQDVRIVPEDSAFPPVIVVEATNRSTKTNSIAKFAGVRLVYDDAQ